MRVEALELLGPRGATDAELERRPTLVTDSAARQLAADRPLLLGCSGQARGKLGILGERGAPPLDAAGGLEARDGGNGSPAES